MSNFELIDDYLANRLNEQDRKSFEQQLDGDPALKEEVEFQQQVVEGVRQARALELKNMLNNVPISAGNWGGGKIAAGIISAGIVATGLYFYFNSDDAKTITSLETQKQDVVKQQDNNVIEPLDSSTTETKEKDSISTQLPVKEKSKTTPEKKIPTPVHKPDIHVVDPSSEFAESKKESKESVTPGRSEISTSKMEVITGLSDKKHNFHYQFAQGKLMLYGPFDKSLYEILEIHGEGHAVFLFYKENYYLLNERQSKITALEPIRDGELLKKLREYRGR